MRTTQDPTLNINMAPGTSRMKARLVRMFHFDNASPEKSCFVVDLVCFVSRSSRLSKELLKFQLEDLRTCVSDGIHTPSHRHLAQ